ncbi:MAG: hypothetical protein NXY57DRAFT_963191 [Lentinula lateritia]|nr:MAG: hypothetical protein NXY57DRAFT_963191 [Lentinula lateritia]
MTRPGTPAGTSPSTPVERISEPPHHHHLSNLLHRAHLYNSSHFHHRASSSCHRMEIGIPHMHLAFGVFKSQIYLNPEAHVWHDPRTDGISCHSDSQILARSFSSNVNLPPCVFNHGMRFADMLGELFDPVILLETRPERRHQRVWTPKFHSLTSVTVFLEWIKSVWTDNDDVGRSASAGAEGEEGEEEDPDRVHHVDRGAILNLMNFRVERRLGIAS